MEFFCNLGLHTYIAEKEPDALPLLEAFPAAVASVSAEHAQHSDLATFEQLYDRMPPQNYGWYQCRLHVAAKHVYDEGGIRALQKLWKAFLVGDAQLSDLLKRKVHPKIAEVASTWPK